MKKILFVILLFMLCGCTNNNIKLEDNVDKLNDQSKQFFSLNDETSYGEHFQIKAEIEKSDDKEATVEKERTVHNYYYTLYILPIYEESIHLKDIKITVGNDKVTKLLKDNGILLPNYDLPYFQAAKEETKLEDYTCQKVTFSVSIYDDLLVEYNLTEEELDKSLSSINVYLKYNLSAEDTVVTEATWME
ncbi:MAG: hypothetical protein Q4C64_01960 [Erysipelotrichia bacterium]|nr:hypothetical protein [Erysipelotrichia bacterium]